HRRYGQEGFTREAEQDCRKPPFQDSERYRLLPPTTELVRSYNPELMKVSSYLRRTSLALIVSAVLLGSVGCGKSSSAVRWLFFSHGYKSEVLAQSPKNGELKHIEWDGWGWAGQDTTVYLVFDPTDSLSAAAKGNHPGKFDGIPCEVPVVHRLESYWYTVQFYTDEFWGRHGTANGLDCSGSAH
ncbi:MAG: hypothetical protein WA639_12040, partial [Candidatus Acidiferrum sp.]